MSTFPGENPIVSRRVTASPDQAAAEQAAHRQGEETRATAASDRIPRVGEWVCWRNPKHARCLWWDETYGVGPFEVVGVVDHSTDDMPPGILVRSDHGEKEISSAWLSLSGTGSF